MDTGKYEYKLQHYWHGYHNPDKFQAKVQCMHNKYLITSCGIQEDPVTVARVSVCRDRRCSVLAPRSRNV
jgi:hypothetical protein